MTVTEITNDPKTWPSGDAIWMVCQAIAHAEGANFAGSVPDRLNNPGDLSDDKSYFGFEHHSGSDVTNYPNKKTGWTSLYNKIQRIVDGHSHVYSIEMTWTQMGQKWAGNWQNWVSNVTHFLGVDPHSTLHEYFKGKEYGSRNV